MKHLRKFWWVYAILIIVGIGISTYFAQMDKPGTWAYKLRMRVKARRTQRRGDTSDPE